MPHEDKLPNRPIEPAIFQQFVVRILLLIATGVLLLIKKDAVGLVLTNQDVQEYQGDLLDLADAVETDISDLTPKG